MIDHAARLATRELLRHLVAGLITNDEFQDRLPRSQDLAVVEVQDAAWLLYSDLREYRLVGKDRVTSDVRNAVARWILFLGTDLEYEHAVLETDQRVAWFVLNVLTLGGANWVWRRRHREELARWPFLRDSDLDHARAQPALLAGLTSDGSTSGRTRG